jgi:exopolysaccharide production protein ExoY
MAHVSELSGEGPAGYFEETLDAPVRDRDAPAANLYRRHVKRALDVVILLLAAPFVLPLVLVLALLVRRDGGSAFYCQDRVGLSGASFRLWKLRSMVPDADRLLEAHLESNPVARAEWDRTQKLKNDPRITPVGRFIRKTSLDELPQLWNVLIGDMSLVGPRPMMPSQTALYPGRAYYALRPGLTGFWQISSRNQTSFAARAAFDARYARRLSLGTDLRVLLATVRVVLRGTGY